ncbi:hypothetical protein JHK82_042300 [Glycine max]|nr:hypothetical protein JHK85_042968 [Glycine max]KAG5105330.1 hypothetical protein JHK82_042300 [Glycine max]KAG5116456.1 hypothetical protein JHK84_042569 [Glycine max]
MQKSREGETGEVSAGMCITYSLGKTLVTLSITEEGFAGRINVVYIDISEDSGKGSFANLYLRVTKNESGGASEAYKGLYESCGFKNGEEDEELEGGKHGGSC